MPYIITWEERGVYIRQYGIVDLDDMLKMQYEGYSSPKSDDMQYILWDGTGIDSINITKDEKVTIAIQDIGASQWKKKLYHATVSANEEIDFLCKQYIETLEEMVAGWKFRHFNTIDEARNWIESSRTTWSLLKP